MSPGFRVENSKNIWNHQLLVVVWSQDSTFQVLNFKKNSSTWRYTLPETDSWHLEIPSTIWITVQLRNLSWRSNTNNLGFSIRNINHQLNMDSTMYFILVNLSCYKCKGWFSLTSPRGVNCASKLLPEINSKVVQNDGCENPSPVFSSPFWADFLRGCGSVFTICIQLRSV